MNNINKTIKGVSLLTDINLALESGHIYGFVGDNGSGKTVLFKVLLGLMHKTSGTILVDGREQKDLMQDVGFIIERPEYIPYYSAKKNLEIIAAYRKVADDQRIIVVVISADSPIIAAFSRIAVSTISSHGTSFPISITL